MQDVNFVELIEMAGQGVQFLQEIAGGWDPDTGLYVEPTTDEIPQIAAVFSLSDEDLRNIEGGQYTADDRKAYTANTWPAGAYVKVDSTEKQYKVQGILKNYDYLTGCYVYHLTRQGVSV